MQQAPRLRTLLVIPPAVRRTPMPQPPARPNSTIPLRKLFFKDNSRFLTNFSRCSTSLRRCVQKSAGNRRGLIIAKNDRTQNPYRGTSQRRATAPRGKLCWHSPSDRGKNRKNLRGRVGKLPARNVSPRAKGFLDRRSKWFFLVVFFGGFLLTIKESHSRPEARNPPYENLRKNNSPHFTQNPLHSAKL